MNVNLVLSGLRACLAADNAFPYIGQWDAGCSSLFVSLSYDVNVAYLLELRKLLIVSMVGRPSRMLAYGRNIAYILLYTTSTVVLHFIATFPDYALLRTPALGGEELVCLLDLWKQRPVLTLGNFAPHRRAGSTEERRQRSHVEPTRWFVLYGKTELDKLVVGHSG